MHGWRAAWRLWCCWHCWGRRCCCCTVVEGSGTVAPPEGRLLEAGQAAPGVHLHPHPRRWRRHGETEPSAAGLPLGFPNPIFDVIVFKQQVRQREEALGCPLGVALSSVSPLTL